MCKDPKNKKTPSFSFTREKKWILNKEKVQGCKDEKKQT